MALTQVPIELSSTPGIVDNSNATAITIDSSENVTFSGTVTADGLNLDGNIQGDTGQNMQVSAGAGSGDKLDLRAGDDVRIYVDGATAHKLAANFANNGDISFYEDTGTTPKLFWDASAESLGIGLSTANARLEVGAFATTSSDIAYFSNSNGVQKSIIRLDANGDGEFVLRDAGNNEDVVITAGGTSYFNGGDLLVGKTATAVSSDGVEVRNNGLLVATRDSNKAAILNRRGSDGDILEFNKDSVAVGSIAYSSGNFRLDGSGLGLHLNGSSNVIYPSNGAGSLNDGVVNLGLSNSRFKDLYLSGGVYLGGTGSANHLDDYEEGTWTPVLVQTGNSVTHSAQSGIFVKVGRSVFISGFLSWSAYTNGTGSIEIDGMPFNVANLASAYSQIASFDHGGIPYTSGRTTFGLYSAINTDKLRLLVAGSSLNTAAVSSISSAGFIYFSGTFYTTS